MRESVPLEQDFGQAIAASFMHISSSIQPDQGESFSGWRQLLGSC